MKKRLMALVLCLTVMMTMFAPLANATEEELLSTATPAPAAATVEPQAESAQESAAPTEAHTEQPSAQPEETAQPAPVVKVARMEEVKPGTTAETSKENAPLYAWVDQVRQLDEIPYRQTKVTPTQKLTLKGGDVWYHVEYKRAGRSYDGYLSEDVLKVTEPVTLLPQEEGDSQPAVVEPVETETAAPEESQEPEATEPVETQEPETTEPAPTESVETQEPETTEATEATETQEPETTEPAETEIPEATEIPAEPTMPSVDDQPIAADETVAPAELTEEEAAACADLYARIMACEDAEELAALKAEAEANEKFALYVATLDEEAQNALNEKLATVPTELTEEQIAACRELYEKILACEKLDELALLLQEAGENEDFIYFVEHYLTEEEAQVLAAVNERFIALMAIDLNGATIEIVDTVIKDGRFTLVVKDSTGKEISAEDLFDAGYTIKWTKGTEVLESSAVSGNDTDGYVYDMDEYGQWVNVAYKDGARKTFTVTITKDDVSYGSMSKDVEQYDSIQNGSFETPACTTQYQPNIASGASGIVWKTTASDGMIEIVSAATDKTDNGTTHYSLAQKWHNQGTAADGTQYAELNANSAGALYQDVLTKPGSTMYWQVSHNGRNGTDTMAVVIAPVDKVVNITTQDQLLQVVNSPDTYGAKVYNNLTAASGENNWTIHSGSYTVPEGQYYMRYFFVAISTADSDNTIGNHIDKVSFSTSMPEPPVVNNQGSVTVTKKIYGLDLATVKNHFTEDLEFITYKEGNQTTTTKVPLTAWNTGTDENGTTYVMASYLISGLSVRSAKTLTFTENKSAAQIENYAMTADSALKQTVTVDSKNKTAEVVYVNRYVRETTKVRVKKVVDGTVAEGTQFTFQYQIGAQTPQRFSLANDKTKEFDVPVGARFEVTETGAETYETTITSTDNVATEASKTASIDKVTKKDTVQEIVFTNKPYSITVRKKVVGSASDEVFTFELTYGETKETFTLKAGEEKKIYGIPNGTTVSIKETNATDYIATATHNGTAINVTDYGVTVTVNNDDLITFTNTRKTANVIVKKEVTGNLGDKSKEFKFVANYTVNGESKNEEHYLKHDETWTLANIPAGTVVTITEDNYSGSGYSTTNDHGEKNVATITVTAEGKNSVTFINEKVTVPDTGVLLDSLPYVVILAVVVLGAALVIVRRRKHRDDD